MSISVSDLLTGALAEIRVARGGDVVNPDDMALALTLFNEVLDGLNLERRAIYSKSFATATLTPNLQPHTIGLTANTPTISVTTARPTRIRAANLVLTNNIRVPLHILTDDQWNAIPAGAAAGQAVTIVSSVPIALWYDPRWPNGAIYLWPVPSTAYGLELETDTLLAQVALTDTLDLPPGYQEALRLRCAIRFAPSFGQRPSPETIGQARDAWARVFGANDVTPDLDTRDGGMPGMGRRRGGFSYLTGRVQ